MKKLKTLLVEDNEIEMKYLIDLLKDHQDIIEIVAVAGSYKEALLMLGNQHYDLSILDYNLGGGKTLFDLYENAGRERLGLIVYTSKTTDVNIEKTLQVRPDFTLFKPFDEDSVSEWILKLKSHLKLQRNKENKYIVFFEKGLKIVMPFENIYYVHGKQSFCEFICKDDTGKPVVHTKTGSIGEFEYLTETDIFIKCDRSYIINRNLIKGIRKSEKVILFDLKEVIPVASYADWFIEWLNNNGF